jgi:hypothetical protein
MPQRLLSPEQLFEHIENWLSITRDPPPAIESSSAPRSTPDTNLLGTGGIVELNVLGFVVAVIAAVLLIGVAEGIAGSRQPSVR